MDPVKRISEMEKILNEQNELIENLRDALEKFEAHQDEYIKLRDYYNSEVYFDDLESYDKGELPADLLCGVLSEDAVYNLFCENFNVAIDMIELATKVLKNR
ncbi:MAG: DUF4298 domain-containing protein [Peptoniphilaceae bacterium]|uniref:DUF4298 domain-containing protein n=2 Tax=Peptoniphilus sp. TaxID=1971214 RepID=UPI0029792886|nr:DUF4298 domain-containing protein [Peptoniphilus sp.]MDD7351989.1 DUF4298 domain-containing protein [Peptoniphilaceae bacterium]MDY3902498.1 DUF4298 domain-containing protein [Peptoniphilus sp.]